MAKRPSEQKKLQAKADKEAKNETEPHIVWTQGIDDQWTPTVFVANIAFPLTPRPYRGFAKNERDAIMTYVLIAVSEVLFGEPKYITNEKTHAVARNPSWNQLPFFAEHDGEWKEFEESPTDEQLNVRMPLKAIE